MAQSVVSQTITALAGSLFLCSIATRAFAQTPPSKLILEERLHVTLPVHSEITGAAMSSDGEIAFWSGPRHSVYLHHALGWQRVCANKAVTIVGGSFVGHKLELVDARGKALLLVTPDGECRLRARLPLKSISAAVRHNDREWTIVGANNDGQAGVFNHCCARDARVSLRRELKVDEALRQQFSAADDGVLNAQIHWPYDWKNVKDDGSEMIGERPFVVDSLLATGRDSVVASRLLALPMMQLDSGFVQQLTDPSSDLRVLILYDHLGKRVRVTVLDSPVGFMNSYPERRTLLGLRTSDVQELVAYGWRWLTPRD